MPPKKSYGKTHDECRMGVCIFCIFNKADRKLASSQKEIVSSLFPNYKSLQDYLPGGSCGTCRKKISKNLPLPPQNYERISEELMSLRSSRGTSQICSCSICLVARSDNRNVPTSTAISPPEYPPEQTPPPNPAPSVSPPQASATASASSPTLSLEQMMQQPLEMRQRVASGTLKEMAGGSSGTVSLKTGGKPLPVQLGARPKEQTQPKVSHESYFKLQNERRFSDRDTIAVAKSNRKDFGKQSIQPNLEKALAERPKEISDFFCEKNLPFENKKNRALSTGVFCSDPLNFVRHVLSKRNIAWSSDWFLRVGIDGGGDADSNTDSIKVTASIVTMDSPTTPTTPLSPPSKKTSFEFQSPTSSLKDTGEKKALILCLVPDVKENPENIQILWQNLDFSGLEAKVKFSVDLKMANILNGQQQHKASFPCNWSGLPSTFTNYELAKKWRCVV